MEPTTAITDTATLMTLGFYSIAIIYLVFSVIFYYHWMQYSVNVSVRRLSFIVYLATTLPLLAIMGSMIFLK